ncbi:hypothetical protein F5Y17DRAFT_96987 [Xylariaceae sp. FL0594]|nr:hypothetical protein F5Y17DRAFT_96987 [Xylariaceae sp. FL0594]
MQALVRTPWTESLIITPTLSLWRFVLGRTLRERWGISVKVSSRRSGRYIAVQQYAISLVRLKVKVLKRSRKSNRFR